VAVWTLEIERRAQNASMQAVVPTVSAAKGTLRHSIRISGTTAAKSFSAIIAPRLRSRGSGNSGGGQPGGGGGSPGGGGGGRSMTLTRLAAAGSIVEDNGLVAEFETQSMEDTLDDRRSAVAQARALTDKMKGEVMVSRETDLQAYRVAKAAFEKAKLDLRTAEVKSEIEAAILKLAVLQGEADFKQIEGEVKLKEISYAAQLKAQELTAKKDDIRLERSGLDLEKMKLHTTVGGLVVLETISRGGGSFEQVRTGDQVTPGTFFMRVVDMSQMIIDSVLNQVDSQSVRIGQPAIVRLDAYPEMALKGRVVGLGSMATSGQSGRRFFGSGSRGEYVKTVAVKIAIEDSDPRVTPDLSASVDILVGDEADQLIIPRSAIAMRGGESLVWVRQGNRFVERKIELGGGNFVESAVLSGLNEGDQVAVQPPTIARL
jgi:multidrug resistance efflux pump